MKILIEKEKGAYRIVLETADRKKPIQLTVGESQLETLMAAVWAARKAEAFRLSLEV